jgi:hypothetical protein
MLFLKQVFPAPIPLAILLTVPVVVAHAAPVDCELVSQNNAALARVVTAEARLNFIAGPGKRTPACPSAESDCRLRAFLVPGDEVLVNATDDLFVCATFKSQAGIETTGWLPRSALQIPAPAPAQQWDGKWQRDKETEIVLKSHGDEVKVSGTTTWGGSDPKRVKMGSVHEGQLDDEGKARGQVLAIGYDPDRSGFPPPEGAAPGCAAQLKLFGRYLMVEDNARCGGVNVSFTGLYVRTPSTVTDSTTLAAASAPIASLRAEQAQGQMPSYIEAERSQPEQALGTTLTNDVFSDRFTALRKQMIAASLRVNPAAGCAEPPAFTLEIVAPVKATPQESAWAERYLIKCKQDVRRTFVLVASGKGEPKAGEAIPGRTIADLTLQEDVLQGVAAATIGRAPVRCKGVQVRDTRVEICDRHFEAMD